MPILSYRHRRYLPSARLPLPLVVSDLAANSATTPCPTSPFFPKKPPDRKDASKRYPTPSAAQSCTEHPRATQRKLGIFILESPLVGLWIHLLSTHRNRNLTDFEIAAPQRLVRLLGRNPPERPAKPARNACESHLLLLFLLTHHRPTSPPALLPSCPPVHPLPVLPRQKGERR